MASSDDNVGEDADSLVDELVEKVGVQSDDDNSSIAVLIGGGLSDVEAAGQSLLEGGSAVGDNLDGEIDDDIHVEEDDNRLF